MQRLGRGLEGWWGPASVLPWMGLEFIGFGVLRSKRAGERIRV